MYVQAAEAEAAVVLSGPELLKAKAELKKRIKAREHDMIETYKREVHSRCGTVPSIPMLRC